jgi:hypothetical protein
LTPRNKLPNKLDRLAAIRSIPQGRTRREQFLEGAHQGGVAERKAMIKCSHNLPMIKQVEFLRISRGGV